MYGPGFSNILRCWADVLNTDLPRAWLPGPWATPNWQWETEWATDTVLQLAGSIKGRKLRHQYMVASVNPEMGRASDVPMLCKQNVQNRRAKEKLTCRLPLF